MAGVITVSGCAQTEVPSTQVTDSAQLVDGQHRILDVSTMTDDEWRHVSVRDKTEYRIVFIDDRLAIRASGKNSASGLVREIEIDINRCPVLEWSWRVDKIQRDADITVKDKEDVAASIFVIFGDPETIGKMKPVPTLRYVWTNERAAVDSFVRNPYVDSVYSVTLRSGDSQTGQWITERRNVLIDFEKAFGHPPAEPVQAFALFTDNDQTKQPAEAYYEWLRSVCSSS